MLVYSGCSNRLGGLNSRSFFPLTLLGAVSPSSRSWKGLGSGESSLTGLWKWEAAFSLCPLMAFLCVCIEEREWGVGEERRREEEQERDRDREREKESSGVSFLFLKWQDCYWVRAPHLWPHWTLIASLKGGNLQTASHRELGLQ